MLITFEGIEGSGKTTQIGLLFEYLTGKGHSVISTREPGGTVFGERLRTALLHPQMHIYPLAELLVFMAARAQHVEEVIVPALNSGVVVLCDRFTDASYAYQGYGRGIDPDIIETLNRLVTKGVKPDLTILLRYGAQAGLTRKALQDAAMDRFENEGVEFHRKIEDAYDMLVKKEPKRFHVIDGSGSIEQVQQSIRERVDNLLKSHGI